MRGGTPARPRAPYGNGTAVDEGMSTGAPSSTYGTSAGIIGRRRALRNGRAVAGAFFIAVAVVLVFASWVNATRSNRRSWVVSSHALAAGTTLSAGDLRTVSMQLAGATAGQAFSNPSALVGRVLAAPVGSGGLIQAASLVPGGQQPALRPVSVSDSAVDLATIAPGDAVDVLVTEGSDTSSVTSMVVRNAQVIAVTRQSSSVVGDADTGVVTLGVHTLAEVEAIVQASHAGTVAVVVAERTDGTGLGAGSGSAGGGAAGLAPRGSG